MNFTGWFSENGVWDWKHSHYKRCFFKPRQKLLWRHVWSSEWGVLSRVLCFSIVTKQTMSARHPRYFAKHLLPQGKRQQALTRGLNWWLVIGHLRKQQRSRVVIHVTWARKVLGEHKPAHKSRGGSAWLSRAAFHSIRHQLPHLFIFQNLKSLT